MERAVVLCRGEIITTQDLPFHLKEEKSEKSWEPSKKEKSLPESLEEIEKGPSSTPSINIRECRRKLPRALASVRGFFDTK